MVNKSINIVKSLPSSIKNKYMFMFSQTYRNDRPVRVRAPEQLRRLKLHVRRAVPAGPGRAEPGVGVAGGVLAADGAAGDQGRSVGRAELEYNSK